MPSTGSGDETLVWVDQSERHEAGALNVAGMVQLYDIEDIRSLDLCLCFEKC